MGPCAGASVAEAHATAADQSTQERLFNSLLMFHGGLAGNVGPVLEMVTDQHLVGWRKARKPGKSSVISIIKLFRV